jgi:hypothetical protein
MSRLTQQVDQRLLIAIGDGEHVDLGDNSSVGTYDRHAVSLFREAQPFDGMERQKAT